MMSSSGAGGWAPAGAISAAVSATRRSASASRLTRAVATAVLYRTMLTDAGEWCGEQSLLAGCTSTDRSLWHDRALIEFNLGAALLREGRRRPPAPSTSSRRSRTTPAAWCTPAVVDRAGHLRL